MQTIERVKERREPPEAKAIERIEGYYESLEVAFGVVYRWPQGCVLVECGCGKTLALTCSLTACSQCDADYAVIVQEELDGE